MGCLMERVRDQIIVIGLGWAGIAAVQALMSGGVPPTSITMLERAPHAGGRAFSFRDKKTGLELDNGQHVLLGCCDAFVDLLQQFDIREGFRFQPLLHIPVYHDGRLGVISSRKLAGPLHLLPGLLNYGHLSKAKRFRLLRVAPKFLRPNGRQLDEITFATWLRSMNQSDEAIRLLWDIVGTAVLNGHADQISAGLVAESFRMGVVSGWRQSRLGLFTRPLGELAERAVDTFIRRGVNVRFSTAVTDLTCDASSVVGVRLRSGETMEARRVISTVPHDALLRILPSSAAEHEVFQRLQSLTWSPILNVFVLYDKSVTSHEVFAATDMGGMFVFNRGKLTGGVGLDGRWLSISISAATDYRSHSEDDIVQRIHAAIVKACPAAATAKIISHSVVWQPRATFLAAPGTWAIRPDSVTPIAGFFLAGDWTNTGWPASLEGAVQSGQMAARTCLMT